MWYSLYCQLLPQNGLGGCRKTCICGVTLILRHCDVRVIGARPRAKGARKGSSITPAWALAFPCALCREPLTGLILHLHIFQQPLKSQYSDRLLGKARFSFKIMFFSNLVHPPQLPATEVDSLLRRTGWRRGARDSRGCFRMKTI